MATTIKLKNGSGAPLAGDLVQGEPAFDLTNKRLYTEDSSGTVIEVGTTPTSLTTTGTVTFGSLSDGSITITAFVDEDNMASNSATLVPTQQSVKAYVDSQVTAQDLDFQGDSGGALSIDLDSETLTIAGGTGIDTTGATNTLTVAIDSTVTTLTGTQTLTNKTLTAPVISSISNTGTLTLPTSTDTLVGRATTDILTNKTLTSPVISSISNTGTLTLPTSTDVLVGRATTDTLTNKTLTSPVINTGVSGTAVLDDDTFATASATTLATSESIKAYVDAQVDTTDQLSELSDVNITTPADGALLFYDTTTTKWIDNVVSGDITIADTGVAAISSGVIVNADVNASAAISVSKTALTAGTGLTLTTDTLSVDASQTQITAVGTIGTGTWQGTAIADAYVADNLTISGGTVDNTVIGGTTAAAGTFTTFTSTGIDDNATSTAITIDSSENVGIGTASPAHSLDVNGEIGLTNASAQKLYWSVSGSYLNWIESGGGAGTTYMRFATGNAEAMRIDASGNLLVGRTDAQSANNVKGCYIDAAGAFIGQRGGAASLFLNRFTSDGDIAVFRRDGTTVGSLSAHGGAVNIGNGIASLAFLPSLNTIHPNGTGSGSDGLTSLGWSNNRFKDLYLSGKLTNNGTGGINIDTSGRVGIGVTPDAWRTTDSVLQLGTQTSVAGLANDTHFSNNAYFDTGSTWKAQNTAQATNYYQSSGIHVWRYAGTTTADTAISWSEAMRIDSSGNVGIGTTSPTEKLSVIGNLLLNNAFGDVGIKLGPTGVEAYIGYAGSSGNLQITPRSGYNTTISSGNVGIGTTSPSEKLEVSGSGATRAKVTSTGSSVQFIGSAASGGMYIDSVGAADNIIFRNTGSFTERMRIDSSGNLLVGKTAADDSTVGARFSNAGFMSLVRDGGRPLFIRRDTSDGDLVEFSRSGTTVGSIASVGGTGLRINSQGSTGYLQNGGSDKYTWSDSAFAPANDNVRDLGSASYRFDDVYATNATIQTSDANEKQDIETLSEAETRVAVAAKALLRKFRWKSSVEEKGDDARIHFGIIAQDLKAAFEAEGLDAGRYAMFIHSTWTDEETGEERSRMGVRYSELLAFIIAAI